MGKLIDEILEFNYELFTSSNALSEKHSNGIYIN